MPREVPGRAARSTIAGGEVPHAAAKILDFIGSFIIKSERMFLVLQREQTDLVELCFKHL